MTTPEIIYQDKDLLVLDKPTGWVVNEAETTKNQLVIQDWLKKSFDYEIANDPRMRSGIVHRLDKETSGTLLVAKTAETFQKLQAEFKQRRVEKEYVALAHGEITPKKGEISAPVGRLAWNRKRFGVVPGGREAVTKYQVLSIKYKNSEPYTLLNLYPKTGRTHQIRVHLKYLGHPIVSDKTYVGRKTWRHDTNWCPRLFLHAGKISFDHPKTGKKMSFESNLPEDLKGTLANLS